MSSHWQSLEIDHPRLLELIYCAAIASNFPTAIWRYPNNSEKHAVVDLEEATAVVDINLKDCRPGFIVAPFSNQKRSSIRIDADLYFKNSNNGTYTEEFLKNGATPDKNREKFERTLRDLEKKPVLRNRDWFAPDLADDLSRSTAEEEFCGWVQSAVDEIKRGLYRKVVLSRILKYDLDHDFEPWSLFNRLCAAYPNAFVSLVAIPGIGTWIGATPELLMSWNHTHLSTVSLAGTNWASNGTVKGWYDKELNEQALVSEYIRECFHGLGIFDYTEHAPETIKIGKLQHLQTKFGLNHPADLKELPHKILHALHPTPAVCGLPKKRAMDFIRTTESHAREFYAGFLGPVNLGASSALFVNLRCMQLQKHAAILYAGAGITEDSDPKKEWQETDSKLDALLTILYEKERVASNGGI